jgi:hypothetical protein
MQDGLRGFSNSVRLDDALALLLEETGVRLTHGSVYGRIWADQRDFQLDVVATAIARYDGAEIANAVEAAATATAIGGGRHQGSLAPTVLAAAVGAASTSRPWNLWLGAHAAAASTPGREDDERLAAALATAQANLLETLAAALAAIRPADQPGGDLHSAARAMLTLLVGASVTRDLPAAGRLLDELGVFKA